MELARFYDFKYVLKSNLTAGVVAPLLDLAQQVNFSKTFALGAHRGGISPRRRGGAGAPAQFRTHKSE